MHSVKVRKVLPKNVKADMADLNKMFDQMTGTAAADISIIRPKYTKVREHMRDLTKVYNVLLGFKEFNIAFPECVEHLNEITAFCAEIKNFLEAGDTNPLPDDVDQDTMNKKWRELKENVLVKTIMVTAGRLHRFEQFLKDIKALDDGFIKREPGLDMCLLSFSRLDMKQIWASDKATSSIKNFILNILSKTYKIGYEVYDCVTSPDIDIKQFSEILVSAIESLKKQIPRCDKAFNVIADSVKLLETNFKSYYRASIQAENPSLIMESFIVDVSMKQKGSLQVMQQFKKIISHLKKQSAGNKDPRVKVLFKMLNNQFDIVDQQYKAHQHEGPEPAAAADPTVPTAPEVAEVVDVSDSTALPTATDLSAEADKSNESEQEEPEPTEEDDTEGSGEPDIEMMIKMVSSVLNSDNFKEDVPEAEQDSKNISAAPES